MDAPIQHICVMSTYSLLCGTMSPCEIVNLGLSKSFNIIGICDINFTTGIVHYLGACKTNKIKPICSVCIKVKYKNIVGHVYVFFVNYDGFTSFSYMFNTCVCKCLDEDDIVFDVEMLSQLQNCYIVVGNVYSILHDAYLHDIHNELISVLHDLCGSNVFFAYTTIPLSVEINLKNVIQQYNNNVCCINMLLSYPVIHASMDSSIHSVLRAIDESLTIGDVYMQNCAMYFENEYYFRDTKQMHELYKSEYNTIAYYNTIYFIDSINMPTDLLLTKQLNYTHKIHNDRQKCLKIVYDSISQLIFTISSIELKQRYYMRLMMELFIYEKMHIYNILYIVYDFIKWAEDNDVPIGPGRGSCVGSLLIYCLHITKVDPVYHGLLFERFLNEYRLGTADVDIDICKEKRNILIDYIKSKYNVGDNVIKVVHIISFTKSMFKSSIKDFARISKTKINFQELNNILTGITTEEELNDRIHSILEMIEVVRTANRKHIILHYLELVLQYLFLPQDLQQNMYNISDYLSEENIKEIEYICFFLKDKIANLQNIVQHAKQLTAAIRGTGVHAAGMLITDFNLKEKLPLYFGFNALGDKLITTQYDMNMIAQFDIFKFDLLGLDNLTIIRSVNYHLASHELYKITDLVYNTNNIMDPVYNMLRNGYTRGIFQIDKPHVAKIIHNMQVHTFDDLVSINALNRPGTSSLIKAYIDNKKHWKRYVQQNKHNRLFEITQYTYGVIMFQEQVMEIAIKVAKYDPKDADIFRAIISKKKESLVEQQREQFYSKCQAQNIEHEECVQLFNFVEKFAGYAFNKSHSVAYAYIMIESAYLKYLNPVRYLVHFINNKITNKTKANTLLVDILMSGDTVFYILPNFIYKNTLFVYKTYGSFYYVFVPISFINNFGIQYTDKLRIYDKYLCHDLYSLLLNTHTYGTHLKRLYEFNVFRAYINFHYKEVNTIVMNQKKLQKKKLQHNIKFPGTCNIYTDDSYNIYDIKSYVKQEFTHYNFSFIYANICSIVKQTILAEYKRILFVVTNVFHSCVIISNVYHPYNNSYITRKYKICTLVLKYAYDDYERITDTIINSNNLNLKVISTFIVITTHIKLMYFNFFQFFTTNNGYHYVVTKTTISISEVLNIIDKQYMRNIKSFIEYRLQTYNTLLNFCTSF